MSNPRMGWRYLVKFLVAIVCVFSIILTFGEVFTSWVKHSVGVASPIDVDSVNVSSIRGGNLSKQISSSTDVSTIMKNESYLLSDTPSEQIPLVSPSLLRNVTLLLSVLDVNSAKWKFTSSQLDYAHTSCLQYPNIRLECIIFTNDKGLYRRETNTSMRLQQTTQNTRPVQCKFMYVSGKPSHQLLKIPIFSIGRTDYVAVMLADTSLYPHKGSKQSPKAAPNIYGYNNLHIPSFLSDMQESSFALTSATIVNHQLFPFLRPQPQSQSQSPLSSRCLPRPTLFAEIQFSVFTFQAFWCLQRHISKHLIYHSDLLVYAMAFHVACNASVGLLDRQHIGEELLLYCVCVCVVSLIALLCCQGTSSPFTASQCS